MSGVRLASMEKDALDVDSETVARVRERVLKLEKEQLHLRRPNNIIEPIKKAIEEEVE